MLHRSLLFVPGARPDRFEKAIASGADMVCIDLEDAVAPEQKKEARGETLQFLKSNPDHINVGLRINALNSATGFQDVVAILDSGITPNFLMLPKVCDGGEIIQIRDVLGVEELPCWPLMESAEGLLGVTSIVDAVGPFGGVMFGGADYSASIGSDMSWDALYHARASVVAAAALADCDTMDVPYLNVQDEDGLRAETCRVKAMGFTGRACIHPNQIKTVNDVFTPSTEEVDTAEKIRAAYDESGGGVALLNGKLVEKPVLRAAERVLAIRNACK